ncbi:LLM class flavin-dependent oxidoreductase [Pseudarthrobacter sp. fls2-241-R2A-168]|uniref:LLM class flavin-dependent oxidoreductase n=1 Tax=Pseudarthrobacter sp. fls2-241-R2A-168 TaxID=3040304 RepID=UPI002556AD9C|nr:LLM class flavin-dependent oxidoreductase [Pseudarthrobacter sp. fls2-241-R2A-168]
MEFGILIGDQPVSSPPEEHFDLILRKVEAAQKAGFTYMTMGHHYLYDGFRWLQPIPLLARLAAELDDHVRIGTTVLVGPLFHPVSLAEDLATLDIVSRGKLVVGLGVGYLQHEYDVFKKPYKQRYKLLEELIEVMTKCWTQPRVTHHGEFFDIDDRPTHIHPIQKPRPPIWLGALKESGVRRAARHGDVWTISPKLPVDDVERLTHTYVAEREKLGLPLTKFPLRRELQIGATFEDALRDFARVSQGKYLSYAEQGMQLLDKERVENDFLDNVKDHAVLGTAEQVRQQLRDIAARVPIGPLLVRPHWPGMDAEQTVAYLEKVGREVVEPLKDLESIDFEKFAPSTVAK